MANQKWLITFVLATFAASTVNAQEITCPTNINATEEFDVAKYMGVWYENQKYPFAFEALSRCISAKYTLNADGTVSVSNKALNIVTNEWEEAVATGTIVAPGKLKVKFENATIEEAGDYWVLGTDYTNYAVVYSCNEKFELIKGPKVWILTRDMKPSKKSIRKAYAVMDKYNLDKKLLQKSYQTKCPPRE